MEFQLPELGEGVYEAEFGKWTVQVGDHVQRGQTLAEVMTDKAVMEIPAPFAGTISSLNVSDGDQVQVGQIILGYEEADGPQAQTDLPAEIGFPGDAGLHGDHDSASTPVETATRGPQAQRPSRVPDQVPREVPQPEQTGNSVNGSAPEIPLSIPNRPVAAAPSVRFMARKLGIALDLVRGSGPGGRILIEDLAIQVPPAGAVPGTPQAAAPKTAPQSDFGVPGTRIKFQGVRRKIAEHLVHAKRTIPHYTYIDECDVTELVRLRDVLREHYLQAQIKLTYLPFFVKGVVAALQAVPLVNSSLDESSGEIVLHDRYHIGIATATPQGLIVPVIHDADQKNLVQIAREIERLSTQARAGKTQRDALRGGTFTITSIGSIGGLASTPVINHPEAAILAIGKIVKRPVYDPAGNLRPADMVYLSLSFDHRIVDGAVGAAFTNALMRSLQRPGLLLPIPE